MPDWEDTYDEDEFLEEDDEMNTEATPDALADTIEMKVDIGPYITQQVAQRVINGVVLHYHKAVDEAVKASIHTLVKQLAADRFTEIARQRLDAVFNHEVQLTDRYGKPSGQVEVLNQQLEQMFNTWLNEKVDEKGATGYSAKYSRTQWMLNELAHKPLQTAVEAKVKEVGEIAKAQVKNIVSHFIAEKLAPSIDVPKIDLTRVTS